MDAPSSLTSCSWHHRIGIFQACVSSTVLRDIRQRVYDDDDDDYDGACLDRRHDDV